MAHFDPCRWCWSERENRAGWESGAIGRYDGDTLTSMEHGLVSGALYARMACVDVTPRTCRFPTAPYAIDAVRTIIDNFISSVLDIRMLFHSCRRSARTPAYRVESHSTQGCVRRVCRSDNVKLFISCGINALYSRTLPR